ncbi:hypothetical protein BDP27DRAFT_1223652 [Rhodocollybia butyracea]|uniref:Uncharacterized protein n=1 Tax=Rhodocollybia butyracea TaxID=206335 RepID=A0A9P5U7E1_9AGAR|nr:hypothetical protein BDP27DRAFT_1223652 [Rhodocollybia butyracea]
MAGKVSFVLCLPKLTASPHGSRVPICAVDKHDRVMLVAVGRPDDPSYVADAERMAELMMEMGQSTDWDKSEKQHNRGAYACAHYGWSYGKGQPQPQRLGGERRKMMREFVNQPCTQRIAAFQSASFALWFPKSYAEFRSRNSQLKEKIPTFDGNIKGSVYACCTANCTNTWTYIHRDGMNSAGACCSITSGGKFDPKKGGQLIIWDMKLIFDFPPGSTILLPSVLFRHSNIPVQKGDKRVSFTQYTAGGIHRWLEYGGRTEDEFAAQDPEGFEQMLKERPERWRKVLDMFSTISELKAGVV